MDTWAQARLCLLVVQIAVGIRNLPKLLRNGWRLSTSAASCVQDWLRLVQERRRKEADKPSDFELAMTERDRRRRRDALRGSLAWICLVLAWSTALRVSTHDGEEAPRGRSRGQDVAQMVASLIPLVVTFHPALLTSNNFKLLGIVEFLIIAAIDAGTPACRVLSSATWTLSMRLPLNVFVFEWPLSVALNIAHFLVIVYGYVGSPQRDGCGESGIECPPYEDVAHALRELQLLALSIALTVAFDIRAKANVAHVISEQNMQSRLAASGSLLSVVCDAVVELDEELRLVSAADRLSVILLSGSTNPVTDKNEAFSQLMHTQCDQQRFEQLLKTCGEGGVEDFGAQAFHLAISNSRNEEVNMDFFHVRSTRSGRTRHLLGVSESRERLADGCVNCANCDNACANCGEAINVDDVNEEPPHESYSDCIADNMSHQSLFLYTGIRVRFNAFTYKVVDATHGFKALFSKPPENFASWLPSSKNRFFKHIYAEYLRRFAQHTSEDQVTFHGEKVCLRVPRSAIVPPRAYDAGTMITFSRGGMNRSTRAPTSDTDVIATLELVNVEILKIYAVDDRSGNDDVSSFRDSVTNSPGAVTPVPPPSPGQCKAVL